MTALLNLRSSPTGPLFVADNDGDTLVWNAAARKWTTGTVAGGVSSVFGRTGAVVAATGDYDSDQVDNVSSVTGASVSDALDWLLANAGAVDSVFGRTGAVAAASGDYDSDQVDNASGVSGSSVSDALDALATSIGALDTDDIDNASDVPGTTASDSLEALRGPVFDLSGATITLTTAHRLGYVRASHSSGCQVVIVAADWQVGDYVLVEWTGAGQPTITAGSGTTLQKPSLNTLAILEQFCVVAVKCVASGLFTVMGKLADA